MMPVPAFSCHRGEGALEGYLRAARNAGLETQGRSSEPEILFDPLQPRPGTPCPKDEVREK